MKFSSRKNSRGFIGVVVILISLGVVGYLVYLQLNGGLLPSGTNSQGKGDLQVDPSKTIQHFRNEVQNINTMQQKNLDQNANPSE